MKIAYLGLNYLRPLLVTDILAWLFFDDLIPNFARWHGREITEQIQETYGYIYALNLSKPNQ